MLSQHQLSTYSPMSCRPVALNRNYATQHSKQDSNLRPPSHKLGTLTTEWSLEAPHQRNFDVVLR